VSVYALPDIAVAERDAITPRGQVSSMLTETELASWYQRLNISESTRTVIDQVRRSDPARRVGGGRSNVSGFYPSRKMGVTILVGAFNVHFGCFRHGMIINLQP
jgi:hypothetical protein